MIRMDGQEWLKQSKDEHAGGNGSERGTGSEAPGIREKPGTVIKEKPSEKPTGKQDTILIPSSSKARARIRVCLKCKHDNPTEAKFCEGCGADLDDLENMRSVEETEKKMQGLARSSSRSKSDNKTIFRRNKTPSGTPESAILEKKKYQSQYIPQSPQADPMVGYRLNTYDPAGYYQLEQQSSVQMGQVQPMAVQQPAQAEEQTSWIIGLVIAAVLFVVLSGLVAAIVVLALK